MLEPRRLATIAIASRVAALLGENVGESAGYRMHGENKTGKSTRLEVITQAILTRMLQSDPSLEGVSVVVIDEFHERSIHADLALAFLKESMILREDLFVIVMSATIETTSLSSYLENASVFAVKGRQFPVEIEYKPNTSISRAVKDELFANTYRTILAFLPGLREILKAKDELADTDAEILVLHSSISSEEQKKVLTPAKSGTQRVILSSAIAETSLTVPDVTIVIDSGLSRTVKMNPATGMERLITERESVFSAEQRAGRAGRVREGRCVRAERSHTSIYRTGVVVIKTEFLCEKSFADKLVVVIGVVPLSGKHFVLFFHKNFIPFKKHYANFSRSSKLGTIIICVFSPVFFKISSIIFSGTVTHP